MIEKRATFGDLAVFRSELVSEEKKSKVVVSQFQFIDNLEY